MNFALKSHSKQKTSPPAKTRVDTIKVKPIHTRTFMSTDYGAFGTYEYETVDGKFIKHTKKAEGVADIEIYIPQANFEEFLMNLKKIGFIKEDEEVLYNENAIIEGTFFKLTNPETDDPRTRTEIYIPHKVSEVIDDVAREVTYDIAKYSRGGKRKSRRKTTRRRKTSRRRK
jgi:hypothetical protein